MKSLSTRVEQLAPSGIRRFFDLAGSMEDVISLGVGEPDFVTPWNVREASFAALEQGYTAYSANAGLLELRQEIALYMQEKFAISYSTTEEIIVTTGASEGLDLAFRSLINPGDEIIVVEPAFVSYAPLIELAGGIPVAAACHAEDGFAIQPETIEQLLTDKTKAIIFCFPSNPTGSTMTRDQLADLALLVQKHDLYVISDEIYAELSYETEAICFATLPGMRERTIIINGFSKAFAMTGWRLGFTCAPPAITQSMLKVHQYGMMCAPTLVQFAGIEALRSRHKTVPDMVTSYRQRRNYFVKALNDACLPTHLPGGAFYAFPYIGHTGLTSEQFAEQLLLAERVAVVPGSVFGASGEGYVRASYASSIEQLQEAIARIQRFMKKWQTQDETTSSHSH